MKLVVDVEVKKAPGHLEQVLREGDPLYPGTVIARIQSSNSESCRPRQFTETFLEWAEPVSEKSNLSELKKFNNCYDACTYILNGSIPADSEFHPDALIDELFTYLYNISIGSAQMKGYLRSQALRNSEDLGTFICQQEIIARREGFMNFQSLKQEIIWLFRDPVLSKATRYKLKPIFVLCKKFFHGCDSHISSVVNSLLKQYLEWEKFFEGRVYDDAVAMLNEQFSSNRDIVVETIYSHTQLKGKNKLLLALLKRVGKEGMHLVAPLSDNLRAIGEMYHADDVSKQCRRLLLKYRTKYRNPLPLEHPLITLSDDEEGTKEPLPKRKRNDPDDMVIAGDGVNADETYNSAYKWVQDQLEEYTPGFTSLAPSEQAIVVAKFVNEGKFRDNVNMVHEDSVEREILSMSPDVRERLIQRYLSRKNSV